MNTLWNTKRKLIMFILCLVMLSTNLTVFADDVEESIKFKNDINYLKLLMEYVKNNYVNEISYDDLIQGAMKGALSTLDPYSSYYTKEEFKNLNQVISGNFGGIGLHITEKDGYITVLAPIEGSPAYESGIKPGDRIYSVDDIIVKDYNLTDVSNLIRGDVGEPVKIGIIREGINEIIVFEMIRDIIKINPVNYKILDDNIGYIKISDFNENTFDNVVDALDEFNVNKIEKIIFDLRDNPGGYLDQVIKVLRLLVPQGPIVHIKGSDGNITTHSGYFNNSPYKLTVLVNGGSASASEIFAGAIQDTNSGVIIGTKTFGKGSVQKIIPLTNGGGLKLTIAEYYTPNMNKVDGVGITPNVLVENKTPDPKIDLSKIPTLDKTRRAVLGNVGLDVLGAEMILEILGYKINTPDGILDKVTYESIRKFQNDNKINGYGALDIETQEALTEAINKYAKPEFVDYQLEKAIELLSK